MKHIEILQYQVILKAPALVGSISLPTCFIVGEKSTYVSMNDINDLKKKFMDVYVEIVADSDHWVHAQKPSKVLEIIQHFIL